MSKIRVSYGVTKNMGNYESARVDASKERTLGEHEDYETAFNAILFDLKKLIHATANELR